MVVRPRLPLAALPAVLVLALASAGLAACSHRSYQDTPPTADESVAGQMLGARPWTGPTRGGLGSIIGGQQVYPLALGNRWDYAVHARVTMVTSGGQQPLQRTDDPFRVEIVGVHTFGQREYFLQQEGNPLETGPFASIINPVRADRSGVYEPQSFGGLEAPAAVPNDAAARAVVDRLVGSPEARAAFAEAYDRVAVLLAGARRHAATFTGSQAGPDSSELSVLRYPLFAGARWDVADFSGLRRSVVGRERITVPAGTFMAWRVRGETDFYGSHDRLNFWYSNAGLIRVSYHFESDARDPFGNVLGRIVGDDDQVLTALTLFDPNAPHALAVSP